MSIWSNINHYQPTSLSRHSFQYRGLQYVGYTKTAKCSWEAVAALNGETVFVDVRKLKLKLLRLQRKKIRNRALLSDMFDQSNYKKQSTKYGQINSFHSVFAQFLTYNSFFNFPLFALYVWLWKSCVLSNIALDFDMIYKSFKSKHIKTACPA